MKDRYLKKSSRKNKSNHICWKGYHRVIGTEPYTKHSCKKNASVRKRSKKSSVKRLKKSSANDL